MNIDTKINLCDSCTHYSDYPYCSDDVKFGDGVGMDNVCWCRNYTEKGEKEMDHREVLKEFLELEFPGEKIKNFSEAELMLLEEYSIKRTKKESDCIKGVTDYYKTHRSFAAVKDRLQVLRKIYNRKEKFGSTGDDMTDFIRWWIKKGNKCYYCGVSEKTSKDAFEHNVLKSSKTAWKHGSLQIEQKTPKAGYTFENCELACVLCNNAKSDLILDSVVFKECFGAAFAKYWEEHVKCKLNP